MTTGDKHQRFLTQTATIWSKYTIDPFVTWGTEKKNITELDSQVTESMRDSQATNPRAESFSKQHPRKHRDKSLELEAISLTHRFCAIPRVLITLASSHSLLAVPHHTPRSSISISEFCISSLGQLIITPLTCPTMTESCYRVLSPSNLESHFLLSIYRSSGCMLPPVYA